MSELDNYLVDRNGDGFIDDANVRFVAEPDESTDTRLFWSRLIDVAAQIGLGAQALPLPLFIAPDAETTIDPVGIRTLDDIAKLGIEAVEPRTDGTASAELDSRSNDLLDIFTVRGLLGDLDGDLLPDSTSFGLNIPDSIPAGLGAALCNLAVRIGLESGGVSFPLVSDREPRLSVSITGGPPEISVIEGGWDAAGEADGLTLLLGEVARSWPAFGEPDTAGARAGVEALADALARTGESRAVGDVRWELQWSAEPETARMLAAIRREILPRVMQSSDVDLVVFVCEPPPVRKRLQQTITSLLREKEPASVSVRVLSAFKAGLSWLTDVVLPGLEGEPVGALNITYRRFEAATPVQHLDMSIRWLQELFPGEEIAARQLGIDMEAVFFTESDSVDSPTYRAEAVDNGGSVIGGWECELLSYSMPFMPNVDGSDYVAVTTGGFVAKVDGERIESRVDTDLDRFWQFWQREALKRVVSGIREGGAFAADQQPFFGSLEVDVWMSAPNDRLGIREENDSAAEALHEDIYFNTLDTIEELGLRSSGDKTSAPGAVVPFVYVQPGVAPHAIVRLRDAPPSSQSLPSLRVSSLAMEAGELMARIEPDVGANLDISGLKIFEESRLGETESFPAELRIGEQRLPVRLPLPVVLGSDDEAEGPPMDRNIHGEEVLAWCRQLARFETVSAWIENTSHQRRPIPGIALRSAAPGRVWSPVKLSILKPTVLIIARHHANEIASTNAAFRLGHLIGTDPEWARLLDHVNIIMLPYENADGAALHSRLAATPGAETWKHHPARYNALGHEFGEDFHTPDSRYGEARARPAVWNRWLPDAIADNHGVPSHEWVQPFGGFGSPPRFRVSYWIPQALIYGIVRYVDDADYPEHEELAHRLRERVSAAVQDTDIGDMNREIGASYRRWGQDREPDRFPGEFHNDMLWHFGGAPSDPAGRGFNSRYPRTTVLSWVTEVNDETAVGTHLDIVARAHLLANRAMIDMLVDGGARAKWSAWMLDRDRRIVRFNRPRPLGRG